MPGVRWRIKYVTDEASRKQVIHDGVDAANKAGTGHKVEATKAAMTWRDKLRAAFKGSENDAQKSSGRIGAFFKSTFGQIAAFFGLQRIFMFSREILKLGMDSAETASKFNQTFGDSQKLVMGFVDSWAAIAGLSDDEAKDFLATTASIIQGLGGTQKASAELSIQIGKMAGDFTSFSNIPIERTSQAITRAMTGEYEALKTLGIAINMEMVQEHALIMTHKKRKDELTKLEIAMASAALIQQQMKVQTGDLELTQSSLANTARRASAEWKNFKTELGKVFTESGPMLGVLNSMVDTFTSMAEWLQVNKKEVAAWASTTVQFAAWVFKGVATAAGGTVKVLYNGGQLVTNMFMLSFNGFKLFVQEGMNLVIDSVNEFLHVSNRVLGTKFEPFKYMKVGETRKEIEALKVAVTQNLLDMADGVDQNINAWDELGLAADGTRKKILGISSGKSAGAADAAAKALADAESAKMAGLAAEAAKEAAKAMAEEVGLLQRGNELKMLSRIEQARALTLVKLFNAQLRGQLTLAERIRITELRDKLKPATDVRLATGDIERQHGMAGGAKSTMARLKVIPKDVQERQDERARLAEKAVETFERIDMYAAQTADRIEDKFARAFESIGFEFDALGTLAKAAFAAVGEAATGAVADWAKTKVKANVAQAIEAGAEALGFFAHGNVASGTTALLSAAKHTAAALAWGALAGGAKAAGSAMGGGRGGHNRQDARNSANKVGEGRGPDIHVHIRPWDRHNPVVQTEIGEANRMYQERYGGGNLKVSNG